MLSSPSIFSVESLILLVSVFVLLRCYVHQKWKALKKWNIPHDPPTLLNFGHVKPLMSDYFNFERQNKDKYGSIWGHYVFLSPRIVVHDVEILREVCIKEFSNFPNRFEHGGQLNGKEVASGLLSALDHNWKRSRVTLAPTFSTLKLKQMSGIIQSCVGNTINRLEHVDRHENGLFVAKDLFNRLSLDVICATAFSTDVNSQDPTNKEPEILKHARGFFDGAPLINSSTFIVMQFPFLKSLFVWLGGMQKNVVYIRNLCQQIMERETKDSSSERRIDLMRLMIQSKISDADLRNGATKGLTSTEIIGNAIVMLLAGYETTGNGMSYFAYNLAFHTDVQRKLQTEIDNLFDREENPSFNAINGLKYLDMCIHENLRLYCPIARTFRTAKNSITICGLTVPKGWTVIIPIYSLAHDPELWAEPMKFKPERMRNMSEVDPVIFQPFGTGPRICIGSRLAIIEMKIAFARLLRRFSFEPTAETPKPPLDLKFHALTFPKVDFKLKAVAR